MVPQKWFLFASYKMLLVPIYKIKVKSMTVTSYLRSQLSATRAFQWDFWMADLSLHWLFCWFCHDLAHMQRKQDFVKSLSAILFTFASEYTEPL